MQNNQNKTVLDEIKEAKGLLLGVIGFAGTIGTFGVTVLGWDLATTTLAAIGVSCVILFIGRLILSSERRNAELLNTHIASSEDIVTELREAVSSLNSTAKETRRDTLRIQLSMYIKDQPENIDTILRLAEEYFVRMHGDWYMTAEFNKWAKSQGVEIPNIITSAIIENEA